MKLSKKQTDNGGYFITVEIGNRAYTSFWTSPPNSIDHVDVEYLRGRYRVITTEKRALEFKRLFKDLWLEVTPRQIELMEHTLGLNYKKKPYRNYFFTNENDKDWNELVTKGLAKKGNDHINNDENIYFWLTKKGVEFVIKKKITDKYYRNL